MAQGIFGDLETEMKSYVASLSTSSTTSLSSDRSATSSGQQRSIRCPICLMKFKDPRRLECQHMFCKDCLQVSISTMQYIVYRPIYKYNYHSTVCIYMLIVHDHLGNILSYVIYHVLLLTYCTIMYYTRPY